MADIITQGGYSFSAVLQPYMPVFYCSFVASLILTPMMRVLAHRHGIVDDPDGKRKVHTQPIAYLGGVSIFLGWLAGVSVSVFLRPHNADQIISANVQLPPGVLLGAATVVLFGLLDDVYSLSPKVKLVGQALAAIMLVAPGAVGIGGSDFFLGMHGAHTGPVWMVVEPLIRLGYLPAGYETSHMVAALGACGAFVICIFVIIATCNATNLLDGLDGLCSGVTGVMSLGYLILAIYLASVMLGSEGGLSADPTRITLSLSLLGAVMGFLPYNFNPASIFMGDTGSMFLGYICGTMILLFSQFGTTKWFLSAIIIFGLPMMDTFLAIVRRKLNGKPIFSPDSNHFHHFLVKRGFTVRRAVLLSYLVAAIFVSFGLVIVIVPTRLAIGIYLVLFGWIVVAAFKMGMIFQHPPGAVTANTQLNMAVLKAGGVGDGADLSRLTASPAIGAPAGNGAHQATEGQPVHVDISDAERQIPEEPVEFTTRAGR